MVTSSTSLAVRASRAITVVLLAVSAAFAALILVSLVTGLFRGGDSLLYGDPMAVPLQVSSDDVGALPKGINVDAWLDADVEIADPTTSQLLLRSALDLGPTLVVAGALWLLAGVMRSASDGDPFGRDNARRFRSLALLLILGGLALNALNYVVLNALYMQVPDYPSVNLGAGPFTPVPGGMLVGGLVAFALAAIFADGARLREDVEGMV